jgi:hypothetical protein
VPAGGLRSLLAPTGEAVASLFAHTSVVAGRPENAPALARAGRAFGALVHLLDAVEDHAGDADAGRFNPLRATGTAPADARLLADELVADVRTALGDAHLVDRALVDVLLGRELDRAVHRALPTPSAPPVPAQRSGLLALLLAVLLSPAVFIGGSFGGGSWGPRRRRRRGGPPPGYGYPPPQSYGYRRVGPSCGQLLACNCCANVACNACCCGNSCAND